jgi:hypothetical protein
MPPSRPCRRQNLLSRGEQNLLAGGNPFAKLPSRRRGHDGHGQPVEHTLLLAASPRSPGVRCVQHFPFLDFLPAPEPASVLTFDTFQQRTEGKQKC